jgi:hypothetical protein
VDTFLVTPEQQAGPPKELYILLPTGRKVDREVTICKNIMALVLAKIASPSFHCHFETVKALASSSDQRVPDRDSWDGWDNQMRDTASSLNQLIEKRQPRLEGYDYQRQNHEHPALVSRKTVRVFRDRT